MAEDEDATVRTVAAYREQTGLLVAQHRGRLVDATGDAFLAEFASAVNAVQCALEIQSVLGARNAGLAPDHRVQLRVGVHVGDLRVEGERNGDPFWDPLRPDPRFQDLLRRIGFPETG